MVQTDTSKILPTDEPTPTTPTTTSSPAPPLNLFGSTLFPAASCQSAHNRFTCMASVRVPDDEQGEDGEINENDRAPVVVVAVVDKSGSMSGDKMKSLKETLEFVISEMGQKDRLAIVEYDSNVKTTLPLTRMDEAGKAKASKVAKAIRPGSTTNMSGGLMEGLRLIPEDAGIDTVVSTLLLTDGLANKGIRTAKGIIAMVRKAQSEGVGRCTVNTFGFGADHDATMLTEIAQACEGMYYFIENVDTIAGAFADCMGGLLSVRAQGVELELTTTSTVTLGKVYTTKEVSTVQEGKKVRISLGDLQNGEERDILFEVALPVSSACDEMAIAAAKLTFFDMRTNEMVSSETEIKIARPANVSEEQQKPDLLVDRNCNRVRAADATSKARELAASKKLAEGRDVLQATIQQIRESPTSKEDFCETLLEEMEASLAGMQDTQRYQAVGQYQINKFSHKMWNQRAADAEYSPQVDQMELCSSMSAPAPPVKPALFSTANRSRMKKKAFAKK